MCLSGGLGRSGCRRWDRWGVWRKVVVRLYWRRWSWVLGFAVVGRWVSHCRGSLRGWSPGMMMLLGTSGWLIESRCSLLDLKTPLRSWLLRFDCRWRSYLEKV